MVRTILVFALFWVFAFAGVYTFRKWKLKTTLSVAKIAFQATFAAVLATLALSIIVALF